MAAKQMTNLTAHYLTTIGGCWYFDRAVVPQRLKDQSLYNKILLLQKFNYALGRFSTSDIMEDVRGCFCSMV
jgi:hypothetical protein